MRQRNMPSENVFDEKISKKMNVRANIEIYYYRLDYVALPYPSSPTTASANIDLTQEQRQRLINYDYYYSFRNFGLQQRRTLPFVCVCVRACAHVQKPPDGHRNSNLCYISENDL